MDADPAGNKIIFDLCYLIIFHIDECFFSPEQRWQLFP